jgi:hypothetical protein
MRAVGLILAIVRALFGAFKLYDAFGHNGNFDAYAVGILFVAGGSVLFWKFNSRISTIRWSVGFLSRSTTAMRFTSGSQLAEVGTAALGIHRAALACAPRWRLRAAWLEREDRR